MARSPIFGKFYGEKIKIFFGPLAEKRPKFSWVDRIIGRYDQFKQKLTVFDRTTRREHTAWYFDEILTFLIAGHIDGVFYLMTCGSIPAWVEVKIPITAWDRITYVMVNEGSSAPILVVTYIVNDKDQATYELNLSRYLSRENMEYENYYVLKHPINYLMKDSVKAGIIKYQK